MRQHYSNHWDLGSAVSIAFDWRKCILGSLGVALFFVGLEALTVGVSLGSVHLRDMPRVLSGLELGRGRELLGLIGCIGVAAVWGLYVFSYFGGAISRMAAVEFSTGRRPSMGEGLSFAQHKFRSFFWSPSGAILLAGLFILLSVVGGLLGRFTFLRIGPTLVALLYVVSLLLSVVVVSLLVGTLLAWGLMFGAVAVEKTDNFDAVSRSLNYLYTCPWEALGYRLLGLSYGGIAGTVAAIFGCLIWGASHLAVGLGMGSQHTRMTGFFESMLFGRGEWTHLGPDAVIFALVGGMFLCLIAGYWVSYVFSSLVIQYLLLRHQADGVGVSEIALDESPEDNLALSAFLFDSELDDEQPQEESKRDAEGVPEAHS